MQAGRLPGKKQVYTSPFPMVMGIDVRIKATDVEQLALQFARHCIEVQAQLKSMGSKVLPSAVACRASRKARKVANSLTTLCGWGWSADPRTTLPVSDEWERGSACRGGDCNLRGPRWPPGPPRWRAKPAAPPEVS